MLKNRYMLIIATLILAGIILMVVELLFTPGIGVAGILGLASMAGSCWFAFRDFDTRTGLVVVIINALLLVVLLCIALRSKTWQRFSLGTRIDSKVNEFSGSVSVGDLGLTETRLAPMGMVRFDNLSCEVKSEDNSMIPAGTRVEVTRVEDNRIFVKVTTNNQ